MEWVASTLGEICDLGGGEIKTGPFGSQLHQSDYEEQGIPVVMPKDIIDGRVLEDSIARVNDGHVERLSQHKLSEGDIVYGRRGDIGRQALVRSENSGWLCGTGCLRVSLGVNSPVSSRFLHLYLKQPDVISWIANQAIGATMPNLNTSILRSVPVEYPADSTYQDELVGIVFAYENLIENNNRRIAILEDMAQSLYREWFVKFRYPGHENQTLIDSPLGPIPEGWEVSKFKDELLIQNGFAFKSKDYSDQGTVIIRTKDYASSKYINISDPIYLPDDLLEKHKKYYLQELDFLLIMVGASIGKYGIVFKKDLPALQNQNDVV